MKTRLAAAALALAALDAAACGPAPPTPVEACASKSNGAVRIVSADQRCWSGEERTSWERQGPGSPAGRDGRDGRDGEAGADGRHGAD